MSRTASAPRPLLAMSAIALSLLLVACGSDEIGGKVAKDGLGCTVTSVDRTTAVPDIDAKAKVGEATTTKDLEAADKDACKVDAVKYLTIDLVGATLPDGEVFTNTFEEENPLTARLGAGQLLAGLETGLADMTVGATRLVVIPAVEAYGEAGNEAQGIGKDTDLAFAVRLLSVTAAPRYCSPKHDVPEAEGKPTAFELPTTPVEGEVVVTVLEEGDGDEVTAKSYPTVHYLGISCATGQQFDSSWDRGEPYQVALRDAEPSVTVGPVIDGWSDGLIGQKVGSIVQLDIPAKLAYGSTGNGSIGPNDPLTFVVEIVESTEEPPADEAATLPEDTVPEETVAEDGAVTPPADETSTPAG